MKQIIATTQDLEEKMEELDISDVAVDSDSSCSSSGDDVPKAEAPVITEGQCCDGPRRRQMHKRGCCHKGRMQCMQPGRRGMREARRRMWMRFSPRLRIPALETARWTNRYWIPLP